MERLLRRFANDGHVAHACLGGVGQYLGDVAIGHVLIGAQTHFRLGALLAHLLEALEGITRSGEGSGHV